MLQFFRSLPITVEMEQTSASVSESTEIKFTFTNNSEEIIYILKWYTPLEGMKSRFLNITFGKEELKYEGIMAKRSLPKAKHYICLKPKQPVHNTIDLIESYTFPYDGEYTIHYIKPLVFLTEEMYNNFDDRLVPYFNHPEHSSIVVTVKKRTKREGIFQRNHNCEQYMAELDGEEEKRKIQELEKKFFVDYDKVIDAINAEGNNLYTKWFGKDYSVFCEYGEVKDQYKIKVEQTFKDCFEKLSRKDKNYLPLHRVAHYTRFRSGCIYQFGGDVLEEDDYAATIPKGNFKSQICFSPLYFDAPCILQTTCVEQDSREQILVHEWTHAFGYTDDVKYESAKCQELANANETAKAIVNADSYSYFYWDVIYYHELNLNLRCHLA